MNLYYLKKSSCFVLEVSRFLCFCEIHKFHNLWRHHRRAFFSSLMRAIIERSHLPFIKNVSNFVHFCPNFQIFCPFLPFFTFFCPFSEKLHACLYFLEYTLHRQCYIMEVTLMLITIESSVPLKAWLVIE